MKKAILLIAVPLLCAFAAMGGYGVLLRETGSALPDMDLIHRLPGLARDIRRGARLPRSGRAADDDGLREQMGAFKGTLAVLRHGGSLGAETYEPAPDALQGTLLQVEHVLAELEPRLAAPPPPSAAVTGPVPPRAGEDAEEPAAQLEDASRLAVEAGHAWTVGLQGRIYATLFLMGALFLAALGGAGVATHRYIVEPILRLDRAARALGANLPGGQSIPGTGEVLARPLAVFDAMAGQIERLFAAVEAQHRHAELVVDSLPTAVVVLDPHLRVVRANRSFRERILPDAGEPAGRAFPDLLAAPELVDWLRAAEAGGDAADRPRVLGTSRPLACRLANGEARTFRASAARLDPVGEEAERLLVVLEDLTDQVRAQEALRRSAESYRALIENSPEPVFVHRDGRIVYANAETSACLGYDRPADLVGRAFREVLHPDDLPVAEARTRVMLESGAKAPPHELRALRRDGSVVVVEVVSIAVPFDGAPAMVTLARDLTERKELASRRAQMDRMSAVGTLAAGIAHEINTPIQFVGDSVDFVREAFAQLAEIFPVHERLRDAAARGQVEPALLHEAAAAEERLDVAYLLKQVPRALDRSREGLARVASIVRAMKAFAHPDDREKGPADLNAAIATTVTIARNEYKYVAQVESDLGELPPVPCFVGELNQVFLNLIVNAAHAIAETGEPDRKGLIRIVTRREEKQIHVSISDNGRGIPEEIRGKIFDPFFTTKPVGKGTGQGLSIAQNVVVRRHAGSLTFESEVGVGTTFHVRIPISVEAAPPGAIA